MYPRYNRKALRKKGFGLPGSIGAVKRRTAVILIVIAMLLLSALQTGPVFAASEPPSTQCKAVYMYDQTTGEVLYEKNADETMTPASTTKIMTAVLVLENVEDLDAEVTVPGEAVFWVGSHMALKSGEKLTVRQLLSALMVTSANDAARVLAIYVAGSQEAFVDMMNAKAHEIGAYHTHYLNPNGYTESWDHCTTARDLGIITDYAFTVDGFADLVSMPSVSIPKTNKSEARYYRNTNLMLWDTRKSLTMWDGTVRAPKYSGTFGVKTGMMGRAGYCLVAGCEWEGTRLIVVCLKGGNEYDRFEDSIALFDWGFANFETRRLVEPGLQCGKVRVRGGSKLEVDTYCEDGVAVTRDKSIEGSNQFRIVLYQTVEAPLAAGDQVGYISYKDKSGAEERVPVTVREDVPEGGFWTKFFITDEEFRTIAMIAAVCILVIVLLVWMSIHGFRKRRKQKKQAGQAHLAAQEEKADDGQNSERE